MSTTLIWQTSVATSALWGAASLIRRGSLLDPRIEAAMRDPAAQLASELAGGEICAADFWSQLLPLSATATSHRHRIEVALAKTIGRQRGERYVAGLTASLREVERALSDAMPGLDDELQLRLEPWRQQWEARGPGLLHSLGRLAESQLLPETATVVLVQPAVGGAGQPYPGANLVLLEAVLTDSHPKLPEIVRLGWLLAQLNLDLAWYADLLPRDRLRRAAALALVPLTLDAAETTELARFDAATLALALTSWRLDEGAKQGLAELLDTWYAVYRDSRPTFTAGLEALDEMLAQ